MGWIELGKEFEKLIEKVSKEEQEVVPRFKDVTMTLKFTEREIGKMSGEVGKYLSTIGGVVRVIKRIYKDKIVYILRLFRENYHIEVEDQDLKRAKCKFIRETYVKRRQENCSMCLYGAVA